MEKLIEILKDLEQGKISADNAEEQVLRLFGVSIQCEHPYNSILKGNDIRPNKFLKCGKALIEHCH